MESYKSGSLESVEQRMSEVDEGSLRHQILEKARDFKTSWIGLGQALYTAWKDKLYKEWGYMTFDAYTAKEIGIKKQTAVKLLKSYYFLEKEEPQYVQEVQGEDQESTAQIPSYESVNLLRLAKERKDIDTKDYETLKKTVFEGGKDVKEVKKDLTAIIKAREELSPEEAREKKRTSTIKRLVGTLATLKRELEIEKVVPQDVIKEMAALIKKLEGEL